MFSPNIKNIPNIIIVAHIIINEATQKQIEELGDKIRKIDGVSTVEYVSKEQALDQMKEKFGDKKDLLDAYEG